MSFNNEFNKSRAWFKLVILSVGSLTLLLLSLFVFYKQTEGDINSNLVVKIPLETQNTYGIKQVGEPKIEAVLETKTGPENLKLLVDSGSTISSLSSEYIDRLGFKLDDLTRRAFSGYGNTTVFAYQAKMKIKIQKEEIELPVVFTENSGTIPILGRAGFFDNYSIFFNHKNNTLEISK